MKFDKIIKGISLDNTERSLDLVRIGHESISNVKIVLNTENNSWDSDFYLHIWYLMQFLVWNL